MVVLITKDQILILIYLQILLSILLEICQQGIKGKEDKFHFLLELEDRPLFEKFLQLIPLLWDNTLDISEKMGIIEYIMLITV